MIGALFDDGREKFILVIQGKIILTGESNTIHKTVLDFDKSEKK